MNELESIAGTAIRALNRERNVSFTEVAGETGRYIGEVKSVSGTVSLIIDCSNGFPDRFPVVKIVEQKRFYPHVEENGAVCLFDNSALIIRTELADQMMIDAFDRAVEILNIKPESDEYKKEVAREFNAYWIQSAIHTVYLNISPCKDHEFKELKCLTVGNKHIISDSIKDSEYLLYNYFDKADTEVSESICMLIRLRKFNVPPIQKEYSWKQLRSFVLKNITSSQKKQFQKFLDRKMKILNRYILLSIPSGDRDYYVGFLLYYNIQQKRKVEKVINCKVNPVMTMPLDYSYLLRRGGSSDDIMNKSVLLIGCGSIGSFIAVDLCQCGIMTLDLLDKDNLSVDNVHRHVLGFNDAVKNKNKADLMKSYLESQFPHVEIDSLGFLDRSAESFLNDPDRLKNYDIIISATGEPMLNLKINRILHDNNIHTPFVVCFNEPYGIGGHAIVVNLDGGCLQCLYTDLISDEITSFRGSFVQSGQDFKKNISGCASSFVEYSSLDSQQTAIITVRLALQVIRGECKKNKLVSWIGSSDKLINSGYRVSELYNKVSSEETTMISRDVPINQRCKVCMKKTASPS